VRSRASAAYVCYVESACNRLLAIVLTERGHKMRLITAWMPGKSATTWRAGREENNP
jgi:aspartokinase